MSDSISSDENNQSRSIQKVSKYKKKYYSDDDEIIEEKDKKFDKKKSKNKTKEPKKSKNTEKEESEDNSSNDSSKEDKAKSKTKTKSKGKSKSEDSKDRDKTKKLKKENKDKKHKKDKIENKKEILISSLKEEKQISKGQLNINFQKALYNFLPKNYKSESNKILKEISQKYIIKKQKNIPINVNTNEKDIIPSSQIEILKDIDVFSTIIQEEIQKEKKEHPENIIPITKAVESPKTSSLFAVGILASFLENNGTEVIIAKNKSDNNLISNIDCLETCMAFATSEIGNSKKYELKFNLDEKQNELLLTNEEEAEKFMSKWKKIISKEMSMPMDSIIFFNPRKGSFVVDVKFLQPKADELLPQLEQLQQKYEELIQARERPVLKACFLSEDSLNSNFNKQLGTWNKSNNPNRGNEVYYPPYGWLGFGLNISNNIGDLCWLGKQNSPRRMDSSLSWNT